MSGVGLPLGRLIVDPSVFLARGAIVCGEVRIGAHSSVWFHTVIRGDSDAIEIGEQTNVQDLTMVHVDEGCPAIVGDRVTIGHRAIIATLIIGQSGEVSRRFGVSMLAEVTRCPRR